MSHAVLPHQQSLKKLHSVIKEVNSSYSDFLTRNNDEDDIEFLLILLEEATEKRKLSIEWHIADSEFTGGINDNYVNSATVNVDGTIDVWLNEKAIDGKWGPISFKESITLALEHEFIHIVQREKMGRDKYATLPSGYMRGLELYEKSGQKEDLVREYLSDPQEVMAHAHDNTREVLHLSLNADILPFNIIKNSEAYIRELPTYMKYRAIFPKNHKIIKKLLTFTYEYLRNYLDL